MNLLNTVCGTLIGVYAGKKLIDLMNYEREPEYKCIFLYNQGINQDSPNKSLSYLNFFIDFVNEATISLDICFFLITDSKIAKAIIAAKQRNVKVRIITDYEQGIVENLIARNLFKAGLKIYYDNNCESSKSLMHHKFCVRDNKTLLQASVNLTEAASIGSYDNVIITEDPEFLIPFREHFEELVNMFK